MSKKDWKKQLLRVKQIADQNLGRAEKSEVLSEELQNLEKRVDLIKQVYHASSKKLLACSQGREGQEFERRLKKMPEYNMSHSMKESATMLKEDTLMGAMFNLCGDAQMILSTELLQHEIEVEKRVITPIQTLLEHDIPTIQKLRKHLTKLTLDMDSTRGRYDSAKRNTQVQGAKLEAIKDEMEEAHHRVESCKDQLSTELYSFMAKESDYSNLLLELANAQKAYHKRALDACERCIPRMEEQMDFHTQMPVFGCPLDDHLRRTGRDIAMVIEVCVCALLQIGMDEEGLFRIAGGATKAKKLKAAFDSGQVDVEDYVTDVHCIAGSLKLYLRELPEPLMTYQLYSEWMSAAHMPTNQRMEALWHVVNKLPKPNYNNLRYLIKFLHKLSESQTVNKMSAGNIAIVIGPNLIWPNGDGGPSVLTTSTQSAIVEVLITHAEWFFPGEMDFFENPSTNSSPAGTLKFPHSSPGSETATVTETPPANNTTVITSSNVAPVAVPLSGSTGSLLSEGSEVNDGSCNDSPRPPRRVKKSAPPPPPDRPVFPTNTGANVTSNAPVAETPKFNLYPALPGPGGDVNPALTVTVERTEYTEKRPKIPERPQVVIDKPAVPDRPSSPRDVPPSPKSDRPKGPPPERPSVPPPEKPTPPSEKPSLTASYDKPPPLAEKPQSPINKIDKPPLMDKPKSPKAGDSPDILPSGAPPLKQEASVSASVGTGGVSQEVTTQTSHQRQPSTGSSRPPRPTPPPPPRTSSTSKETTHSTSEEAPPKPPERKDCKNLAELNTYL